MKDTDNSEEKIEDPTHAAEGEAQSLAIVANAPGMVFQYVWYEDGRHTIPFVSDQCFNLLGITVEALQANPELFMDIVLREDREGLRRSRDQSATRLNTWNWEGRLWIESFRDVKWVSLRASPRREKDIGVIWEGIIINITQSRRRETELKESHERLREVSSHVMAAREHERIRIAQEIHDDLGGNLTAIKIDLDWLGRHITDEDSVLLAKIHTIDQLVDRTIDSIRRMSRDLRPGIMDFGIVAAIEWESGEFSKRLGIPCEVVCAQEDIELDQDAAVAVFRIFQEALTNIAKHGRASHVWVRLDADISAKGQLELEVRDNGRGITPADTGKLNSFGIRGMIERAGLLDGKLTVSGAPGEGTAVHLSIPLGAGPDNLAISRSNIRQS
ncbi:sensor histidine kinase [Nitrosospira sp. Nsp13]|uniref:sensor histidine kinase n=1 Tax=Nitrosospira sp. Nsp13 TaxID=1855332 RepID=UPI000891BDB2|nr:sensor histidine kinase [Nitrosospira sp. Nsp13]SCX78579.1 PAS fold-containing protein [Nitrosospira sp. Nsp13]